MPTTSAWAWTFPTTPASTAMPRTSSPAGQNPYKRQSRIKDSSKEGPRSAAHLTALPTCTQPEDEFVSFEWAPMHASIGFRTVPLESIRHSLFRSRKTRTSSTSTPAVIKEKRAPRPSLQEAGSPVLVQQECFASEQDYYHYLKKMSISWPTTAIHLTPSDKPDDRHASPVMLSDALRPEEQIIPLATQNIPKQDLPSMKIECTVQTKELHHPQGSGSPQLLPSTTALTDGPLTPDTREDHGQIMLMEHDDTKSIPDPAAQDFSVKPAARASEIAKVGPPVPSKRPESPRQASRFNGTTPEFAFLHRDVPFRHRAPSTTSVMSKRSLPLLPVPEDGSEPLPRSHHSRIRSIDRMTQPLPPLPSHVSAAGAVAEISMGGQSTEPVIKIPERSARRLAPKSPRLETNPAADAPPLPMRARRTLTKSVLSDVSWEEDIDFCYEQEAESTCDFDWKSTNAEQSERRPSKAGSRELQSFSDAWIMTSPTSPTSYSPNISESSGSIRRSLSGKAHYRYASAARHRALRLRQQNTINTSESGALKPPKLPLQRSISSASAGLSSPTSVTGSETYSKYYNIPGGLQLADLNSQIDYLSDPESCDWKRPISSSYGSRRSSLRRSQTEPAGETVRWSLDSAGDVPDLLRSKHKSETSIKKHSSFCDLLDAHPNSAAAASGPVPELPRTDFLRPARRRPKTPIDCIIVQNAGQAAQRGRLDQSPRSASAVSNATSRMSTTTSTPHGPPLAARSPRYDFEEWI